MRIKSQIGKKQILLASLLLCILVTCIVFIMSFLFAANENYTANTEPISPNKTNNQLIKTEDNSINVDLQRYYASLDLLDKQKSESTYVVNELNKEYKEYKIDENNSSLIAVDSPQFIADGPSISESVDDLSQDVVVPTEINQNEKSTTQNSSSEELDESFDSQELNEDSINTTNEDDELIDLWADDWDTPELFPPTLFDPLIQTQEEYEMFNPEPSNFGIIEDESFFDDFYVAGSDTPVESLYPDGSYYLSLFIGDDQVGEIKVEFNSGVYSLNVEELQQFLYSRLSAKPYNRIFNNTEDLISIDELIEKGVDASIDLNQFAVFLKFSLADVPLIIVPVSRIDNVSSVLKNNLYGINDAEVIEPEFVSLVSALNLYSSYSYGPAYSSLNPLTVNLYMSNSLQVGKFEFNFSDSFAYTFGTTTDRFVFDFGSWSGTYLFYDDNITLTFGQVGGNLISTGTPIGFVLEKSYGTGKQVALKNQFSKTYKVVDDASLTIVLNGEVILSRTVKAGEYKFVDFSFNDGGNKIIFEIDYDDESIKDVKDEYNVAYDSELLALGDYLWGLSGSFNKTEITEPTDSLFALPYFDGSWYQYNFDQLEMMYWFNMGVSESFTLNSSLALTSGIMELSFEGILATMKGAYYGSLTTSLSEGITPSLYASLSHSFDTRVGAISTSLSLTAPIYTLPDYLESTPLTIGLGLGYTFYLFDLPPISSSLSVSGSKYGINASTSFGMTYTPVESISFVTSFSASKSYDSDLTFSLQLALNYSLLSNLSASTSFSSTGDSSVSLSHTASDRDSLQFSISNIQYLNDELPSYNGSWSHTGDLSSFSLSQSVDGTLTDYTTSLGITSNLYFANGLFAIDSNTSNNFLLIKPTGKLKDSDISISQTNDSTPNVLKKLFGISVYTNLTANADNNIIVYGQSDSIFSSGGTFSYKLSSYSRTGFTKTMDIATSYTVSGILTDSDGTPISEYSSPVYSREVNDKGDYYLQIRDDLYLFTDSNGRWVLNDVKPGYFVFDLQVGKQWYGIAFEVEDNEENDGKVIEMEDYQIENIEDAIFTFDEDSFDETSDVDDKVYDVFGTEIAEDYSKIVFLNVKELTDEEVFFEKTKQVFSPTGFDESIGVDDDEVYIDPFADTASEWVDDDEYSF